MREYFLTEAAASFLNPSSETCLLATQSILNWPSSSLWDSRKYNAGRSLRWVRSPVAPKMVKMVGQLVSILASLRF